MSRKLAFYAATASLMLAPAALAHHPSAVSSTGAAGPINTISATTLDQGQSAVAIFFEMVKISPFSDAQLKEFAGHHVHAHSLDSILVPSLGYSYGVTKDFTISARLPYIIRQDIREGSHHHDHDSGEAINGVVDRGDSDGIGDLTLLGQYRFLNNRPAQLEAALLFGVKAPTGRTGLKDKDGEVFETEFQPGTGSWDGLLGLAVTRRFGSWSFDASVLYVLATEGAQSTDMGDRFQYNAAVSYRLMGGAAGGAMRVGALSEPMYHGGPGSHSHGHKEAPVPSGPALDLVLELNGEWHDKQEIAGVKDPNSGGNVVYLSPGVRLSQDKWSGFVSIGVPVINDMNGVQAEPDWRLFSGVAVAF
jgi:hypothetical protein